MTNSFGDTCAVYAHTGSDSEGRPTYNATGRSVACRVQHKFQRAFAPNGEIVNLRSTLVFLPAGDTVAKLDKIVLNGVDGLDMMDATFDHVHDRDGKVLYKVVSF